MNIIFLPALVGLVLNGLVLVLAYIGKSRSSKFQCMVSIFVLIAICEILLFFGFFNDSALEYLVRCYYVVAMAGLAAVVIYTGEVARDQYPNLKKWVLIPIALLSLLLMFTDSVISGSESIGYVETAIKGQFYWLFQVLAAVMQFAMAALLILAVRNAENRQSQAHATVTLFAVLPLIAGNIGIMLLMAAGVSLNATLVMPIMITLVALGTFYGEAKYGSVDMDFISKDRAEISPSQQVLDLYERYARDELSYRDAVGEIERLMVLVKFERTGRNASETAKLLGMPRTSLYSIFTRLGINGK